MNKIKTFYMIIRENGYNWSIYIIDYVTLLIYGFIIKKAESSNGFKLFGQLQPYNNNIVARVSTL